MVTNEEHDFGCATALAVYFVIMILAYVIYLILQ